MGSPTLIFDYTVSEARGLPADSGLGAIDSHFSLKPTHKYVEVEAARLLADSGLGISDSQCHLKPTRKYAVIKKPRVFQQTVDWGSATLIVA